MLGAWWPVLVLMYVPSLVATLTRIVIGRAFLHLDRTHPDDLPLTAGEWLGQEIARLDLADRLDVIVTDRDAVASLDAYHPQHETIQLTTETYFKRDPMHWAIAAHELGHARFKLAMPITGRLIIALVFLKRWTISVALALALTNIVFAIPGVTGLAFAFFVAGAAMHVSVLLDEAVASILAMRALSAHDAFSWSHLRSARIALWLAFGSYAISFAARVLLLTQWHLVENLSRTANVPPLATLTPFGLVLAALASLVLVAYAVSRLAVAVLPNTSRPPDALIGLAFQVALVGFVLLVWNTRADAAYARWVALAIIPVGGWFIVALSLPMIIVDIFLIDRIAKKLVVDPTDRTPELRQDQEHASGRAARKQGNSAFAALVERSHATPVLEQRIAQLVRVAYIPLVVAFWFS